MLGSSALELSWKVNRWSCTANVPQMFFQAVFAIWPKFVPTSLQQKAAAQESQLGDSHQLAGLKMVLSRDHVVQKRWSCEVVGSDQLSQGDPGLCWGSSALMIVDLTFHEQWHICQVRRQPSCSGSFAWLGSHPSLATRKDATVEVVLATCHKCSSKLCLLFGPFGPTSLQQKQLRKNHTLADLFQSVPWNALIREDNCFTHMT